MSAMEEAEKALTHKNTSIWIMPEGTRSKGRGLLNFKKGAFVCAKNTGKSLLPVCIENYIEKLDLNSFKKTKIRIRVLPPINPSVKQTPAELSQYAYDVMRAELSKMNEALIK